MCGVKQGAFCFLFILFLINAETRAAILPLFHPETVILRPDGKEEWVNRASSFYVWQNDPELRDLFVRFSQSGSGATALCVPAAIGNALLHEYSRTHPRADRLKLPGLSIDGAEINTVTLLRALGERCGSGGIRGYFEPWKSVECVHQLMRESGYARSTVKLIRDYGDRDPSPGVLYEERAPNLRDLEDSLRAGYQVIASFSQMKWDDFTQSWQKLSGHSVNVVGFSRKTGDHDERLEIYVQNPTRAYELDGKTPVFDEIDLRIRSDLQTPPKQYSNIEARGGIRVPIHHPGRVTFLSGLILINADPESLHLTQ